MLSIHHNYTANHISRNLRFNSKAQQSVMEKLASGFRINTAADAPADLIISEQLRSQIDGLERAIQNTSESSNILGIMEGALSQVQGVITKMRQLAIDSANTGVVSPDRVAANQAEMDCALQAIDRILGSANYGGRKLLDNLVSENKIGQNYSGILNAGKLLNDNPDLANLLRGQKADSDSPLYVVDPNQDHLPQVESGALANGDKTFVLTGLGPDGDEELSLAFAEGETLDSVIAALRQQAAQLPEEVRQAAVPPGFSGENRHGTDINVVELDADTLAGVAAMSAADAAAFLGDYMQNFTRELELDFDGWEKLSDADKHLLRVGDSLANLGMKGPNGLGSTQIATGTDGNGDTIYGLYTLQDLYGGGAASLARNPEAAMAVLKQAGKDIAAQRAGVAAAQNALMHERGAMEVGLENLTRMESHIRDTDYAEATMEMARTEIISQVGFNLLKAVQQQQKGIIDLIA